MFEEPVIHQYPVNCPNNPLLLHSLLQRRPVELTVIRSLFSMPVLKIHLMEGFLFILSPFMIAQSLNRSVDRKALHFPYKFLVLEYRSMGTNCLSMDLVTRPYLLMKFFLEL